MNNDTTRKMRLNLLGHIEKIIELAKDNGLTDAFFEKAKKHTAFVARKLQLTTAQAALFSFFIDMCDDQSIRLRDIAKAVKCGNTKLIQYMNDFDELEKRKLLCCCRSQREHGAPTYRVPINVIDALRKGETFKAASYEHISLIELFSVVEDFFEQRNEDELTYDALVAELNTLLDNNQHLSFTRNLRALKLDDQNLALFTCFCHLFVNNDDDNIGFHDIGDIYQPKGLFRITQKALQNGTHELLTRQLIENTNSDGFGDRESFKLTDNAKTQLLSELNITDKQVKRDKNFILAPSISEKKLFYNEAEAQEVARLTALLRETHFQAVQKRLAESGMHTGFACLFSGPPGTGKTETAYQIARETGRDLLMVNIAETKSMWFGESEKRIKALFDRYRTAVEGGGLAPILLFNEADAVISKRKELSASNRAVDQTENTIQNIILQEMENLNGILIATSNLTQNMDRAFERRFLYKIEFAKPGLSSRIAIWRSLLPAMPEEDARVLSTRFDFSGGQIENIARKRMVNFVIVGTEPSLDTLIDFCEHESLSNADSSKVIGFAK
jgi:hypothetical protein